MVLLLLRSPPGMTLWLCCSSGRPDGSHEGVGRKQNDWKDHNSCSFWAENFGRSLEGQGGPTRGSKVFNRIIQAKKLSSTCSCAELLSLGCCQKRFRMRSLPNFVGQGGYGWKKGQQGKKRILGFQLQGWMPKGCTLFCQLVNRLNTQCHLRSSAVLVPETAFCS